MDPDQLASSEASLSGSTRFSNECVSGFTLFLKGRASILLTKLKVLHVCALPVNWEV